MFIERISDRKVKVILGNEINIDLNLKVNRIAENVKRELKNCVNIIISYASVYFEFDSSIDMEQFTTLLNRVDDFGLAEKKDILVKEIPVCYCDEFALDKGYAEEYTGLGFDEIVKIHTEKVYYIYFLGFLPGFPYLGGLDKRIHMPRKKEPRVLLKGGSVGIGGVQTGIYPIDSPGGWQIIGRTPVKLFDKEREEPFLLKSGEGVVFKSISRDEYDEIYNRVCYSVKSYFVSYDKVFSND